MEKELNLIVAKTVRVYDCELVQKKIKTVDEKHSEKLKKHYSMMLDSGSNRYLVTPVDEKSLESLKEDCPNFIDVIEDILAEISLCKKSKKDFKLYPILLAGDPGIGKTYFSQQLAAHLGVPCTYQNMSTLTAGWVLSGSSSSWSGAKCGKVAELLTGGEFANPLMLLDEIDKTGGDHRYDPFGAILELFEPETSKSFKDEFLDMGLNASHINWVCTANNLNMIPDYIKSRMKIYEIEKLSTDLQIVQTIKIYTKLLRDINLADDFEPLSEEILTVCLDFSTRELKKKLYDAIARATRQDRVYLKLEDFKLQGEKQKYAPGFLPG